MAGSLEVARMLWTSGANVSAADEQGDTPLLAACKAVYLELAIMLVHAGADVLAANKHGNTPLLAACRAGNVELADMLVREGASVKACSSDGAGMLSLAILSGVDDCFTFAVRHSSKLLQSYNYTTAIAYVKQLAQAFLDVINLEDWLHGEQHRICSWA